MTSYVPPRGGYSLSLYSLIIFFCLSDFLVCNVFFLSGRYERRGGEFSVKGRSIRELDR